MYGFTVYMNWLYLVQLSAFLVTIIAYDVINFMKQLFVFWGAVCEISFVKKRQKHKLEMF